MTNNSTQDKPIVLTLTIPVDESGLVNIVGSKGDVSKIWQVAYGDQNDLAAAIHAAAWDLVNLEMAPPPRYDAPAMPGKTSKKAAPAQPAADAQVAEEPPEDIHAAGDAAESQAVDEALDASLAAEPENDVSDESLDEEVNEEIGGG